MIMIALSGVFEKDFALVGFVVAIRVREHEDIGRTGNDHAVAEHTNAERGIKGWILIKGISCNGRAVAVLVFKNNDPVAAGAEFTPFLLHALRDAVVRSFRHPNASTRVDIHIRRVYHHWLGG